MVKKVHFRTRSSIANFGESHTLILKKEGKVEVLFLQ